MNYCPSPLLVLIVSIVDSLIMFLLMYMHAWSRQCPTNDIHSQVL